MKFSDKDNMKQGTCPAPPEDGAFGCSAELKPECSEDSDCQGEQKCCMWNCGKACVEPEPVGGNGYLNCQ